MSLKARASSRVAKLPGNAGQYLRVLNADSEYGLSLDTRGREWLRLTWRSASSWVTVLDVIEVPLSAWIAPGAIPLLPAIAFWMNAFARSPFSVPCTSHRVALREKMSSITYRSK